jgi:hypothetical protein
MTQIIWNGVDSYLDLDSGCWDYDVTFNADGTATLYTPRDSFDSISVEEVERASVPVDDDGDLILDGLYVTTDYRIWRAL